MVIASSGRQRRHSPAARSFARPSASLQRWFDCPALLSILRVRRLRSAVSVSAPCRTALRRAAAAPPEAEAGCTHSGMPTRAPDPPRIGTPTVRSESHSALILHRSCHRIRLGLRRPLLPPSSTRLLLSLSVVKRAALILSCLDLGSLGRCDRSCAQRSAESLHPSLCRWLSECRTAQLLLQPCASASARPRLRADTHPLATPFATESGGVSEPRLPWRRTHTHPAVHRRTRTRVIVGHAPVLV